MLELGHESRRIDNQLVGRSGRQGDWRIQVLSFDGRRSAQVVRRGENAIVDNDDPKIERGQPIEHPLLSRIISSTEEDRSDTLKLEKAV